MPYELSFKNMTDSGKSYLLSTDLPWIGKRTNTLDHPVVEMLSDVENPVGVKIGSNSDRAHILGLDAKLNPKSEHGKMVFMLRLEDGKDDELDEILSAIAGLKAKPVIMYDIHGVTRTNEHGEKIRSVPEIESQIAKLAQACRDHGLTLHGIHVETMDDNDEQECVDDANDRPTRPGYVDPRLNPRQLEEVIAHALQAVRWRE